MKILLLLFTFSTTLVFSESPTEVLTQFKKSAQANDFDATWKHTAKFAGLSEEHTKYFKQEVQEFIELTLKDWDFKILEEKIEGDCAVVVINQHKKAGRKSFDLDPIYLIKQQGEWKVLPELMSWRAANQGMEDKVPTLEKLKAWFKIRKAELKHAQLP